MVSSRRHFGSIRKLPSSKYQASYWHDGTRHVAPETFLTRADALAYLSAIETDLRRGEWIDPRSGNTLFGEYAKSWRAAQIHRPTTAIQVETNLRRHVLSTFERRPLSSVRTTEIQAWVRRLEDDLAQATVRLVYGYVASIFRSAVRDRLIASSPCVGIKLPKLEPRQVEPLLTEVVERLIDAVPRRYRALVILGAGTGLRQGEAFGLTLDRVDFCDEPRVDRQLVLLPGSAPVLSPPKTQKSHRTIPLPEVVVGELAVHLADYPGRDDGSIFTNEAGAPIRRTGFSVIWREAVVKAGAPKGTGFHAWRHYYASC